MERQSREAMVCYHTCLYLAYVCYVCAITLLLDRILKCVTDHDLSQPKNYQPGSYGMMMRWVHYKFMLFTYIGYKYCGKMFTQ